MDFQVRTVGGIESCFVSLPLSLIQTLQSTISGFLPPVLALELRSSDGDVWVVAWSGCASTSSDIEVAQQFAECISLPDHSSVKVRACANLPKATLVTIEPHTEDDWEVLELNEEHAEAAILKQVGIVHEAMRFPLWLHGRTIVTFLVISIFPRKPVVQLVPGSEVAVAPKRREKYLDSHKNALMQSSDKNYPSAKAQLRIQDSGQQLMHKSEVNGVELGVVLTNLVFIHPETATNYSFDSCQLVVIEPRLPSKENYNGTDMLRKRSISTTKEFSDALAGNNEPRRVVVYLLISESVAKGHVMMAQSLRHYLRTGLHSWVYIKRCNINLKKEISSLSLSPCQIKMFEKNKAFEENGLEVLDSHKPKLPETKPGAYMNMSDLSIHEKFAAALSFGSLGSKDEKPSPKSSFSEGLQSQDETLSPSSDSGKGLQSLLQAWFLAHLEAINSRAGREADSLVLGNETLLHFNLRKDKLGTTLGKFQASSNDSFKVGRDKELSVEVLYILAISDKSQHSGSFNTYQICFHEENKRNSNLGSLELLVGNLRLGEPVSFNSIKERTSTKGLSLTESSSSWIGTAASDIINRLTALLSPASGMWFSTYNLPLPGHVLIYGPPGSGKTLLARTVAKALEEQEELLTHIVFVSCSQLALEKAVTIREALSSYLSDALDHAPSLVIFDDLDLIISSPSVSEGSQPLSSVTALTEYLTDILDEYGEKRKNSCGIGPLAFIASAQSLENVPQSLSSSGRFDFHVQLPAPATAERMAILKHEIQKRSLQCADDVLSDVAAKCDGYDAYDLEILLDRTIHSAISRFLPSNLSFDKSENPTLVMDDFSQAMHEFLPVAMRDITKSASASGHSGWEDVGGLADIRNSIKEMIELPSKFPNIFAQSPLRLRSNILLYGPPGCGKTHIVGAAAAACSLRFISVKGPELLNKYIGASEQAVRDIFLKAAAASPCLLFFDEFDSIAPKRGHDNTGVTDRVVNQFLTELDGVEVLTGVFVFAATSRPDLLDAALLRPGRLDRLLFCDFPSRRERLDILTVLSRKLPLADDVDMDAIAYMTEGFSGADLQALLSDAQLEAVHELLATADNKEPEKKPVITYALLKSVASKARPSISDAEKERLYTIYNQFLDSKKSTAQSRDAKGKRATLA